MQQKNAEIKREKRKIESKLVEQHATRLKVEEKLKNALQKATEKDAHHKKKFKQLAANVAKVYKKQRSRGPQKNKTFNDYTKNHQARIRKEMKDDCQATLSFLGLYNFLALKVEVYNNETRQYETFHLLDENLQFTEDTRELADEDVDSINLWLYIKDKFHIPNEAWHELSMINKDIPTLYSLNKRIKNLNSKRKIFQTSAESAGVRVTFKQSLTEQIS